MINILSKETIDKIAAGEVIERPENVVKELLENAVDSGAAGISVEIREGGLSLIRVTDNGCGISKEDIPLAFLRHATSKLKTADDLYRVSTMGFRGEALASICGVSEVEMITKEADSMFGCRYEINGGVEKGLAEVGAPEGTTIVVRNLFFNVPARKKFLKSGKTEAARIADIVEKTALSHPERSFRLVSDGRNLLHTAGSGRLKDVIFSIYGREISDNLIELSGAGSLNKMNAGNTHEKEEWSSDAAPSPVMVTGYIGKPVVARSRRDFEVYFVNGRYIKSQIIERAIEDAYKPFMMLHKFPFVMLNLTIDPERVDVNVHPKKMEVRFSDGEAVYEAVYQTVSNALMGRELITAITPDPERIERPTRGIGALPVEKEQRVEPFEQRRETVQKQEAELRPQSVQKAEAAEKPEAGHKQETNAEPAAGTRYMDIHKAWSLGGVAEGSGSYPSQKTPVSSGKFEQAELFEQKKELFSKPETAEKQTSAEEQVPSEAGVSAEKTDQLQKQVLSEREETPRQFLSESSVPQFRMIGQVFKTYWLIEFADKLYIIDQHAAHEKVNYERTMRELKEKTIEGQMILPPIQLSLSVSEALLLRKYMDIFTELGYEIDENGDRDFLVRAVPANLYSIASKELLMELIDGLSEDHGQKTAPDILRDRIASMSCKAAVKGNRDLSEEEMKALIGELLTLENPYACPHGRPTIISMSKYELDRKFKRIV
ncbi:MAG: DNA mismatch repair endonuclease MutL [Eubacteriales bacterium]|nr:DNA mismatch repair endonuclease MutL [Eubacteriales bacterium]